VEDSPLIPFTAPTVVVTPTPAPSAAPTAILPSPTPTCSSSLFFVEDLTIPDGTSAAAGETLDKRWLVENDGTCNWDDRYTLVLVTGAEMGSVSPQPLYPALAGSEAVIRIIFIAPDEPGTYRSAWQALDPSGQPFGDSVFVEIVVP
jgi:hypothetical protein